MDFSSYIKIYLSLVFWSNCYWHGRHVLLTVFNTSQPSHTTLFIFQVNFIQLIKFWNDFSCNAKKIMFLVPMNAFEVLLKWFLALPVYKFERQSLAWFHAVMKYLGGGAWPDLMQYWSIWEADHGLILGSIEVFERRSLAWFHAVWKYLRGKSWFDLMQYWSRFWFPG